MITAQIGRTLGKVVDWIVQVFAFSGINPNFLTAIGSVINGFAAYLFAVASTARPASAFRWAGATVILAGIFDLTDGMVARSTGRVTPFGAFFDSVMDRYSDLVLLIGLLVFYGRANRFGYVVLVAVAMIGSVMVSYARARAETLIPSCKVGFLERPERVVLLIIGALFTRMEAVLWVIAVLSNLTVIHRVMHTRREARRLATQDPN